MHLRLSPALPAALLLLAATTHACVNFSAVTQYSNGQMDGGITDNGAHTCTINTIPGFRGGTSDDDAFWPVSCVAGYSATVTKKGAEVAYCNPENCYTFAADCRYDSDAIRCSANVFGC